MNFTSKFTVILTEFPAFTTRKLFIFLFVNFGLTKVTSKNREECYGVSLKSEKLMNGDQIEYLLKCNWDHV